MQLQAAAAGAPPTEAQLAAALADALLPSVPCFRPHWRKMARAVLHMLRPEGGAGEDSSSGESPPAALPPLYADALRVVARDALVLGHPPR